MAITIDFKKEYADLICEDVPKIQCESYPHQNKISEKYRKKFVHPENGFVKLFCEDYEGYLTPDDWSSYHTMLQENLKNAGINIFDLS